MCVFCVVGWYVEKSFHLISRGIDKILDMDNMDLILGQSILFGWCTMYFYLINETTMMWFTLLVLSLALGCYISLKKGGFEQC